MANKAGTQFSVFPTQTMIIMAVVGGLLTGGSMEIINYWPLPVSVVPYFGFWGGFLWGMSVGAVVGLVIGFLTDEVHFDEPG